MTRYPSHHSQRWEPVFVRRFVAQANIKAFDESVLFRLAQSVAMPRDPGVLVLVKESVTGQLGAIIADYHARQFATFGEDDQLANEPLTRRRGVDDKRPVFLGCNCL